MRESPKSTEDMVAQCEHDIETKAMGIALRRKWNAELRKKQELGEMDDSICLKNRASNDGMIDYYSKILEREKEFIEEIRKRTLAEYIDVCHNIVFMALNTEEANNIPSYDPIDSVHGNRYPARLEPWPDFMNG